MWLENRHFGQTGRICTYITFGCCNILASVVYRYNHYALLILTRCHTWLSVGYGNLRSKLLYPVPNFFSKKSANFFHKNLIFASFIPKRKNPSRPILALLFLDIYPKKFLKNLQVWTNAKYLNALSFSSKIW